MGIVIDKYKTEHTYDKHANISDNFSTDKDGRLIPQAGESFEIMPLGSLEVIAYVNVGKLYQQNPYTSPGMRWEVSFSENRVSFYSPDTDLALSGIAERSDAVTMGFYYYSELRSLSLGSMREPGGAYVSMVFSIQAHSFAQIPVGVRVQGSPQNLTAFATILAARLLKSYEQLGQALALDLRELGSFFEEASGFNYHMGEQTDLFISAEGNTMHITRTRPRLLG